MTVAKALLLKMMRIVMLGAQASFDFVDAARK